MKTVQSTGGMFAQLCAFLGSWRKEARAKQHFETMLDIECVQDLAAEASGLVQRVHALAHKAEVHDLEAATLLERALAGGLDASDVPAIRRALALLRRSAADDHAITEVAHA